MSYTNPDPTSLRFICSLRIANRYIDLIRIQNKWSEDQLTTIWDRYVDTLLELSDQELADIVLPDNRMSKHTPVGGAPARAVDVTIPPGPVEGCDHSAWYDFYLDGASSRECLLCGEVTLA